MILRIVLGCLFFLVPHLDAMMSVHKKALALAEEIGTSGDEDEKQKATLYLENVISSDTFIMEIDGMRRLKERQRSMQHLMQIQKMREKRTLDAIDNLVSWVEKTVEEVEVALALVDKAGDQYSFAERWLWNSARVTECVSDNYYHRNDYGFECLIGSGNLTSRLYGAIVDKCKGWQCSAIIQAIQSRYNVRECAQNALLRHFNELIKNTDVFNAFLDLGIKPYRGWYFAGDQATFTCGAFAFWQSSLCRALLNQPNPDSLIVLLKHFPFFATKQLLHKIVEVDEGNFTLLQAVYWRAFDFMYPEFPHVCIANDHVASKNLKQFLNVACCLFSLDYSYTFSWWSKRTVLDTLAYKIFSSETSGHTNFINRIEALRMLLDKGYTSADSVALIKSAEEKAEVLKKSLDIYIQSKFTVDSDVQDQKKDAYDAMNELIVALKKRFTIEDIQPQSIVIEILPYD